MWCRAPRNIKQSLPCSVSISLPLPLSHTHRHTWTQPRETQEDGGCVYDLDHSDGVLGGAVVMELAAGVGDPGDAVLSPGSGRSPFATRKWNPLQYSCLESPVGRRALQATVHGAAKSDTAEQLSTSDGITGIFCTCPKLIKLCSLDIKCASKYKEKTRL